jgi:hypothetical protein
VVVVVLYFINAKGELVICLIGLLELSGHGKTDIDIYFLNPIS